MRKIIFYLLLTVPLLGVANEQSQLKHLKQQIENLQQNLQADQLQQSQLQQNLQQSEEILGKLASTVEELDNQLKQKRNELQIALIKQQELQASLVKQQEVLARLLRVTYQIGETPYLKLLLNGEEPNKLARQINYYYYIQQTRLAKMTAITNNLKRLISNQQAIRKQVDALDGLQLQRQKQRSKMLMIQDHRKKILKKVSARIQDAKQRLQTLISDKQALEKVIQRLQVKPSSYISPQTSFGQLQGKLSWPTAGKITIHFGTQVEQSGLRYTGVTIVAPAGQEVHAINAGRVIFADWLAGYGLLLIIDHGNGYMSLYGHNRSLYKKLGEIVKTGDVISSVGNSGGNDITSLYFEIRYNGRASDPQLWCR